MTDHRFQRVLIVGASGGIGQALAEHYALGGAAITRLSRRNTGFDLTDPDGVEAQLGALAGPFDLIIVATGALEIEGVGPEKSLSQVNADALARQFAVNAIGPALILRHVPRLMDRQGAGVCAVLSARVGSIGDNRAGGWYGYRAAKAAVNQIVRTGSIELARSHKGAALIALHPGTVRTKFTENYLGRHPAVAPEEAAANIARVLAEIGPAQTGQFFDWKGEAVPW
ncbi:SDR family NAD(P)-dependent oxidoreductase [Rhodobacteraceae bacterium XHP0102]|nr:SDR family NAD(P)-dependent oxidoreductase [Rhodobacteraceae bacterium XHP0102]